LPPRPVEIKAHPHGVELGQLIAMLRSTHCRTLSRFLREEFSRVGPATARRIIRGSSAGLTERSRPGRIAHGQAASLHRSIARTRIRAPGADCVVPIGEAQILAGLRAQVDADLCFAVTRPPAVYRGNPFVVEVGVAFGRPGRIGLEVRTGGHLAVLDPPQRSSARVPDAGQPIQLLRYANRVPLMFQQSACAITKTVIDTHWHAYGLDQPRGALPIGPLLLLVHVASVWVPFTSESKEAIAAYAEIQREIRRALQICGRRLRAYLHRGERLQREHAHRMQIEKYLPHVGTALQAILGMSDSDRDLAIVRLETLIEQRRRI
jgi:DNA topoisomerase-6 subunit B